MASKPQGSARDAQVGQVLVVIHEFSARSEDELSLKKGDKITLIERDDDFGDGWYLGRHEQNGTTGLFPEVYTRPAIKYGATPSPSKKPTTASPTPKSFDQSNDLRSAPVTPSVPGFPISAQPSKNQSVGGDDSPRETESMKNFIPTGVPAAATYPLMSPKSSNTMPRSPPQQSTVMNETINVINEHITDLRRPSSGSAKVRDRRVGNDSGSEYSNRAESRLSYIPGQETDEEEHDPLTELEVSQWSPERVAEYLEDAGVEKSHCEIFVEQEISGDVLLGMDQSSFFLKEFELGSVGRRMRTWHKVKALQDELRGTSRSTSAMKNYTSQASITPDEKPATNGSMLPRMSQLMGPSGSGVVDNLAQRLGSQAQTPPGSASIPGSLSNQSSYRPSAANIRSMGHARRHSSMDMVVTQSNSHTRSISAHSKQPSLDQTWTMNGPSSQTHLAPKPQGFHAQSMSSDRHQFERHRDHGLTVVTSPDPDRGYASGGDIDGKKTRNVLTKRTAPDSSHHRHSSYGSERRPLSAAFRRTPKEGSPTQENIPAGGTQSTAAKLYNSVMNKQSPKTSAAPSTIEKDVIEPPTDPTGAPTVTKLEYDKESGAPTVVTSSNDEYTSPSDIQTPTSFDGQTDRTSPVFGRSLTTRKGIRAISDAVTGREKAAASTTESKRDTMGSGTSTPSGGTQSIDYDPHAAPAPTLGLSPIVPHLSGRHGAKSKKATSAYQRGLQRKTPQEQMEGCDYSGWMKKKSSNLMTTWKPRLFVLRGRRLSYYYSENDTEEKGLIDISSHRVLPADNDRLTGLHATLTGAGDIPNSPAMSSGPGSPTSATANSSAGNTPATTSTTSPVINLSGTRSRGASLGSASGSSPLLNVTRDVFIFKLVPPRAGLSRAVNFTKPTVHYFAVSSVQEGRQWMAALLKATIDRDETKEVVTTYQHKTISLAKARGRRELPPFLGGVDEVDDEGDDEDNANNNDNSAYTPGEERGRSLVAKSANDQEVEGVPMRSSSELRRSGLLSPNDGLGHAGDGDAATESSSVTQAVDAPESIATADTVHGEDVDAVDYADVVEHPGDDRGGDADDETGEGDSSIVVHEDAAAHGQGLGHDGLGIQNVDSEPGNEIDEAVDAHKMDSIMDGLHSSVRGGQTLPATTFGQPAGI